MTSFLVDTSRLQTAITTKVWVSSLGGAKEPRVEPILEEPEAATP